MHCILNSRFRKFGYSQWIRYFQYNSSQRLKTDFSQEKGLPLEEKRLIFPSIVSFQKGEGSEGGYFQKESKKFAEKYKEPFYPEAVNWFIKEENMHSAYLTQFMDHYGVAKKEKNLLDSAFRKLRHINGLYSEVSVLMTAEIIALTYYRALGNAASSDALKKICRQMLHDELPHIIFQSYTLGHFRQGTAGRIGRKLLMWITCAAVWLAYGKVFQAGGYSFQKFLAESLGYLRQSYKISGF